MWLPNISTALLTGLEYTLITNLITASTTGQSQSLSGHLLNYNKVRIEKNLYCVDYLPVQLACVILIKACPSCQHSKYNVMSHDYINAENTTNQIPQMYNISDL